MSKKKVLIVGGGFAGLKAALELVSDPGFNVTLISDRDNFYVYSTLYRVATGGSMKIGNIALSEIFDNKQLTIVKDKADKVDGKSKVLTTASKKTYPYDDLILALGSETNFFNIEGLEELSFGVKSPDQASELKNHLHNQLIDDGKPDLNYVVVGAGPTGVELAGALPQYIKKISQQHDLEVRKINVSLIEASSRVLPTMPKDVSHAVKRRLKKSGVKVMTNQKVESQTDGILNVNSKPIHTSTVIWTAGTKNNSFFTNNNFQLAGNSRVRVNQFLEAEPHIYVIGDNADTPYSGMAQTAIHDGLFVAANLRRVASGEDPQPYTAKKAIHIVPVGSNWAAVLWGRFRIYGIFGWWLRRLADLIAYRDYEPWNKAIERWLSEEEKETELGCFVCRDNS